MSYTVVRVFFFFLWGYGRATHSHIDGPKNVKLPKLVSFIIFSRIKRQEKRRIELSRFSLLFSFFTIWFFLSFGSLPLTVPRKCLVYLLHYSFTFVMRISHHRQIWPTHRYAIISSCSCSFLSVTSSAPTKKHFEFRVWSLRQMSPSLFHWPDRNFRHYKKSTNERISIFCFFLLFWFSSRLGGGIWVIRNPMKCALDDLNNPQEKKRGPSAESRVCVAFDLIFKTRTKEKKKKKTHTWLLRIYT